MWERVLCPGVRRARLWGPLQPLFLFGTGHHLQGVGVPCAPRPLMSSGSLSLGAWTDQGVVCGVSGLTPSLSTLAKGLLCAWPPAAGTVGVAL